MSFTINESCYSSNTTLSSLTKEGSHLILQEAKYFVIQKNTA